MYGFVLGVLFGRALVAGRACTELRGHGWLADRNGGIEPEALTASVCVRSHVLLEHTDVLSTERLHTLRSAQFSHSKSKMASGASRLGSVAATLSKSRDPRWHGFAPVRLCRHPCHDHD